MFNAIKIIHQEKLLSVEEKEGLVKLYRAQLSNPELYVLFFNVMSRFVRKWDEYDLINEYKLLKNLPQGYCENYNPKDYYNFEYEYEELANYNAQ